ncbi:ATP-binding protein [Thermoactinospora rubra]|uniref:sensor histidine kinase n=1 Tax=Thermoactinospora rubra TaxID=1088767 RepID=UPI001F0AADFD|nr:ATP-binding protein [Thermoactinospora rubra]
MRAKVVALLASLTALWAFSAWVTVGDGVNLLWATTVDGNVVQPSEPLLEALQGERRLTVTQLAASRRDPQLPSQRADTDRLMGAFAASARSGSTRWAADEVLNRRIEQVLGQLADLKALRQRVDAGRLTRQEAQDAYDELIDGFYRMYDAVAALDDKDIARDGRALAALSRAGELLARHDSLVSGMLATGHLTDADRAAVIESAAVYRYALDQAASQLPDQDRQAYQGWAASRPVTQLHALERGLTDGAAPGVVAAGQWRAAADAAQIGLNTVIYAGGDRLVERAAPMAVQVVARLLLAGVLGLVAVVASVVMTLTTTRTLLGQLRRLRETAHELADHRLPSVVERVSRGEDVDLAREAPALDFGDNEIGQVAQAFTTVQRTALEVAAGQAALRVSQRDTLTSLARRTQGLVNQQITVLDDLQRRHTTPEELEGLFRLDHLASRLRRNAENLLVLAGATPARSWRNPVPMLEVVRGALAEIDGYTRVSIMPLGEVHLAGKAVGDVVHLLAEIIENATSFSPPHTTVTVAGQYVANGYALEVEDRGLGMPPEDLEEANRRIADPPEFKITGSAARLGFHVVSQLAARHDIKVTLRPSAYGGTTVVILLPPGLVTGAPARTGDAQSHTGDTQSQAGGSQPRAGDASPRASEPPPVLPPLPRRAPGAGVPEGVIPETAAPEPARPAPAAPAAPPAVPAQGTAEPRGDRPAPAPGTAEPRREPAAPERTPGGLPMRVPQTHLAPGLQDQEPPATPARRPAAVPPDDAEEMRARLSALQAGTQRGRDHAQQLLTTDSPSDPAEPT